MKNREFKGYNGDLILTDDAVIIKRGGKGFWLGGMMIRGDKTIPYDSITAVQFKEATFTTGYIQLSIKGGPEAKGGLFEADKDENTITFIRKSKSDEFLEAKKIIEQNMMKKTDKNSVSGADELEKFASLRDRKVITDEEFNIKKKEILGF